MDILNFISWIKGKRQLNVVDPAKTLLPIGIKDGRRDDDYLTGAISVADFITQVGTGTQGPQGVPGEQGQQGNTGPQGIQGPTGAQGSAGNSVTILGSYTGLAAFNAGAGSLPGTNIGDAWILLSDGSLYSWNGTNWFDAGDIKGPQGDQGIQGIQGVQGVQGLEGIQGIQGVKGDTGATGGWGAVGNFYDSNTQTTIALTPTPMRFGHTVVGYAGVDVISDGVNLTRIRVNQSGIYNIQFSCQALRTSGGQSEDMYIWLRKNGNTSASDVPDSSTRISFANNGVYSVLAWNWVIDLNAGEYVQLMWLVTDPSLTFTALVPSITPAIPAEPSILCTVIQIG